MTASLLNGTIYLLVKKKRASHIYKGSPSLFIRKLYKTMLKLNESQLRNIINSSVRKVIKEATNEGWTVEADEVKEAYQILADALGGEEAANEAIVRSLGAETLSRSLAYLLRMYEVREWQERDI